MTLQFGNNALLSQLLGDHDRHLITAGAGAGRPAGLPRQSHRHQRRARRDRNRADNAHGLYHRLERGHHALQRRCRRGDQAEPARGRAAAAARRSAGHPHPQAAPSSRAARPRPAIWRCWRATKWSSASVRPAPARPILPSRQAVAMLQTGQVDRIILSRPAVEAGERLGFLPGDMKEKVDPYLRPLYDALHDMMPGEQVIRRMAAGEIEVAPLAFMRGRTLSHAFAILDEAQNTTAMQMKMFLTRMGEGTRMVITGDPTPGRSAPRRQFRPRRCAGDARRRAGHRRHPLRTTGCRASSAGRTHRRSL